MGGIISIAKTAGRGAVCRGKNKITTHLRIVLASGHIVLMEDHNSVLTAFCKDFLG